MATVNDEWAEVENAYAHHEHHPLFRTTVTAMRRIVDKIKADPSLRDLEPSVTHASLVFRRRSPRSVLLEWNEQDGYKISFLGYPFEALETTKVTEDNVVEVLRQYLERAARWVDAART
jgi:hypothetical protein